MVKDAPMKFYLWNKVSRIFLSPQYGRLTMETPETGALRTLIYTFYQWQLIKYESPDNDKKCERRWRGEQKKKALT